ncbi:ABC transporter ATP-binding protein [Desulfobacula sp.]|uniref:ABC transporter ATP-binding protein n=1 Tax=Desulfobacula sp. TaxID=2593537 RepID=UPI0026114A92|nr:ABC transporter ATP-binding protein [Desulfobacula sp.]
MLTVSHICKGFDSKAVLKDISFQLDARETIVILGPSGCGKTTLLHLISGLEKIESGRILIDNRAISKPIPDVALILQNYGLLPWKTNLQNVALGLKIQGVSRKDRNTRARKILTDLGLAGRENDYPSVMSGGEQQRVAIARAYASEPRLLLMDEPFSSLDAITRENLQDTLLTTWLGTTVPYLLVTHSVEEAVFLGKRILILSGSPASIHEIFDNPGFGDIAYRRSSSYYELIRSIRHRIGEYW